MRIAVVLATRGRPVRLARLLDALGGQSLEPAEVVVVLDGADPSSRRVAEERGATVRVLPAPGGPARARNDGWRAATAPWVAFTDDDCRPDEHWLAGLAARAAPGRLVQGRTLPDPEDASAGSSRLLTRTVRIERLGPHYETCNILYPRAVLEQLGGFDESYRFSPGEDTDLAWRALGAGAEAALAEDALVYHAVERVGVAGMLRLAARWRSAARLIRDHPATRGFLWGGLFWNVWHYLLWRSLLSLALPRSLRRLIVQRHLRALRRRAAGFGVAGWRQLPAVVFLLAYDGVECWAVARDALRHRVLVL